MQMEAREGPVYSSSEKLITNRPDKSVKNQVPSKTKLMAIVGAAVGGATLLDSIGVDVKGAISKTFGRISNIFGLKRSTKRRRRDRYVKELHAAGLKTSIGQDSEYWSTAQFFSELNKELPGAVIDVLNSNAANYGSGPEIPRRGSRQFNRVISEIEGEASSMYQPVTSSGYQQPGNQAAGPAGVSGNGKLFALAAGVVLLAITLK